jgi:hypothetical protein
VVPLGQEDAARNLRSILRALPASAAITVRRENNVTVRTYNDRGQSICLIVNECPWHADVTLDVMAEAATAALPLVIARDGTSRAATEQFAAGRQLWSMQLAPYDVHAVRFSAAPLQIKKIESQVSDAGRQELAARVTELVQRDLTATPRYTPLKNPGFEPIAAVPLPGWQFLGDPTQGAADLDARMPQDGKTCLYLQNRGAGMVSVVSEAFATPPTGQLGMLAFVRGQNVGPNTSVRLVFETEDEPTKYRRFSLLGGNRPGAIPITGAWGGGYAFGQDNLPLDSRGQMRVKFELSGPGEIWIDNVQLYDLLFPLYFYDKSGSEKLELVKLRTATESALERGEFAECVRKLEGYWPRFLNAYTPAVAPTIANQPAPIETGAPAREAQEAAETPSVGSRWFGLPSFFNR